MEDLESLGLRPVEYTPRIGTSDGGLRKFGFEASRIPPPPLRLELLMQDFESLGLRPVENPSPWCVETNHCIPQGYRLVQEVAVETLLAF